jgi:hypothetical protein
MGITSSDDFLRGALTGNWAGLGAPLSAMPEYPGQYNLSPVTLDLPRQDNMHSYHPSSTQQNGSSIFTPSPFSDGGTSSSSNGNVTGAHSTFDYAPSLQPLGPSPVSHNVDVNGQTTDTILLWDNFLRDLGLQNVSN